MQNHLIDSKFKTLRNTFFGLFLSSFLFLGLGVLSAHEEADCPANYCLNRVCHFEIHSDNPEQLGEFYHSVFGWNIRKWDNPDVEYWIIMTGPFEQPGGINGGIMRRFGPKPVGGEAVHSYVCTIGVSDIDEYAEKVVEAGGQLTMPKMGIPTVGWLVYCEDTDGNLFGMMQFDQNAK